MPEHNRFWNGSPLGQATIPERLVCRGVHGSSVLSGTTLPGPSFIPPGSPCTEASRLSALINLRPGRVVMARVTQYVSGLCCLSLPYTWMVPKFKRTWYPNSLSQAVYAGPGLCLGVRFKI